MIFYDRCEGNDYRRLLLNKQFQFNSRLLVVLIRFDGYGV